MIFKNNIIYGVVIEDTRSITRSTPWRLDLSYQTYTHTTQPLQPHTSLISTQYAQHSHQQQGSSLTSEARCCWNCQTCCWFQHILTPHRCHQGRGQKTLRGLIMESVQRNTKVDIIAMLVEPPPDWRPNIKLPLVNVIPPILALGWNYNTM